MNKLPKLLWNTDLSIINDILDADHPIAEDVNDVPLKSSIR